MLAVMVSGLKATLHVPFLRPTSPCKHQPPAVGNLLTDYEAWPPSRAFLDQFADRDGRITVVGANWAYLDIFAIWQERAVRAEVLNYVVIAYDRETFAHLRWTGRVLFPPALHDGSQDAADFSSDGFHQLTRTRPGLLKPFLELGYSVFYTDTDTVFRRDPNDVLDGIVRATPDLDVILSEDGCESYYCSCLLYLTPRPRSVGLVQQWLQECVDHPDVDDQPSLNWAMSKVPGLNAAVVPVHLFPSGKDVFVDQYDWDAHPDGPAIVHANWMHGYESKINALRDTIRWDRRPARL